MKGSYIDKLFQEEPAGTFSHGHVFINAPDIVSTEQETPDGYWHCDIAGDDKLTWTEKVYELFGLANETPVAREWAVERYAEPSRSALATVRTYALNRKLGFLLDAAINPEGGGNRWIRVLAVPIVAKGSGRVVGLHGLKRLL